MQYKPVLLVLSGVAAAFLAFTLLGPGDPVTVEKKTPTKGRADVVPSNAQRLQIADHPPALRNAGGGGAAGNPGASMADAGREGGIVQQKQAKMTPEQAQLHHDQAWQGMQQNIQRIAAKHDLSPEATTELSGAMQGYMSEQKALWDSVAAGEITQQEAMAQSQMNRTKIQVEIAEAAGDEVAIEMGGMLGGGAPGDAQGNMGGPPGMQPGGMGPPPGDMGPPPGGQ